MIGRLAITAFTKKHDAADPHSFMISQDGLQIGVFTDIGVSCEEVIRNFRLCHAVFLESNYCEEMLDGGRYPYFLKQRIRGGHGHLSNREALDLFVRYRSPYLRHIILSHLSSNNNRMELVNQLFTEKAGDVKVTVASRFRETELFALDPVPIQQRPVLLRSAVPSIKPRQLSLF